ncbi:unnamed protein product [Trifolium pratense]|uniref:Uncharacterized protein n=1 Tax=Trifolium pratense TaxID=57577 RepID=A0ACB0JMR2_TRIPR|nr:unnamed protein product [Trifolium pratense]
MDKSWIMKPRGSDAYELGVMEFIKFAFKDKPENIELICPCKHCGFKKPQSMSVMSDHLSWSAFPKEYTIWLHHGETVGKTSTIPNIGQDTIVVEDPIQNMINDAFGIDRDKTNEVPVALNVEIDRDEVVMPTETQERNEAKEFYELTREGEEPLRKPKTLEMTRKNAANRAKLKLNHSLGTKSIARTQQELEKRDGRKYSRGEMFAVSHKKSDGSFVIDEAKKKNDQLQAEIAKTHSENEAFVNVFGKEHGGFARSMGLEVTPSQLTITCSARLTSSSEDNEKMKKMQAEIDSLTEKASQVDILKEQVAFLMQMHNSKDNQICIFFFTVKLRC